MMQALFPVHVKPRYFVIAIEDPCLATSKTLFGVELKQSDVSFIFFFDQCGILAFLSTLFLVGERLIANISVINRDTYRYRSYPAEPI